MLSSAYGSAINSPSPAKWNVTLSRSPNKRIITRSPSMGEAVSNENERTLQSQANRKVEKIVAELVDTENSFVESLQEIVEGYIAPLKEDSVLSGAEEKKIFANLPDILHFHSTFLQTMRKNADNVASLAKNFTDNATPLLQLYSPYCIGYSDAVKQLDAIRLKDSSRWSRILRCQCTLQHQLPLSTYLLKPVQRILKYHLLLQELLKAQKDEDNVDDEYCELSITDQLDDARQSLLRVADELNVAMQVHQLHLDLRQQLCQLNDPRLSRDQVDQLGDLVLCDYFRIPGKRQPRFVWLFNSAMLFGKPRSWDTPESVLSTVSRTTTADQVTLGAAAMASSGLALKEMIQCKNLMLVECIPKEPLSFHVLQFDNPKNQVTLQAQSSAQKQLWCQEIKRLILEHYDKAIPERVRDMLLHMGGESEIRLPVKDAPSGGSIYESASRSSLENLAAEDVYQPYRQRHRRNLSTSTTVTTDLLALWDDIVAKHSKNSELTGVSENSTSTSKLSDDNYSVLPSIMGTASQPPLRRASPPEISLPDDMDFRCIAVEINWERFHSNGFDSSFFSNFNLPSTCASESMNTNLNNSSDKAFTTGTPYVTYSSYTESLDNVSDMMSVYEAYISKARSDVELTFEDLEEILRPLRELRSGPVNGGNGLLTNPTSSTVPARSVETTEKSTPKEIPIYAKVIPRKDRPPPSPSTLSHPTTSTVTSVTTSSPSIQMTQEKKSDNSLIHRKLPAPPKPSIDRSNIGVVPNSTLVKPSKGDSTPNRTLPSPPESVAHSIYSTLPDDTCSPPSLPREYHSSATLPNPASSLSENGASRQRPTISATLPKKRGNLPAPPIPNSSSISTAFSPSKLGSSMTLPHPRSHSMDTSSTNDVKPHVTPSASATPPVVGLGMRKKNRAPLPPVANAPCDLAVHTSAPPDDTSTQVPPSISPGMTRIQSATLPLMKSSPSNSENVPQKPPRAVPSRVPLATAEEDIEENMEAGEAACKNVVTKHSAFSETGTATPPQTKGIVSMVKNFFQPTST